MNRFFKVSMLAALITTFFGCRKQEIDSDFASVGRRVGNYKGITAVETTIKQRIMVDADSFSLLQFLDSSSLIGLPALLGGYDGRSANSTFQNASPNAVNTMLWAIVMEGAATEIANAACRGNTSWHLESHFAQTVKTICTWPAHSAEHAEILRNFWLALMRYDAPKAEMEAWVAHMSAPVARSSTALKGVALVKDLTQSILMSPYFLFEL